MGIADGKMLAEVAAETVKSTPGPTDWLTVAICIAGLAVMAVWLVRFGGPKALAAAPVRRHCVPLSLPFMLFFAWMLVLVPLNSLMDRLFSDGAVAARNVAMLGVDLLMIVTILVAARRMFARGLTGFGLNPKTLPRDAGWALVNLAAAYPMVIGGIWLVVALGRLVKGDDFTFPAHESLTELAASNQIWLKAMMVVLLVVVVPVMEEMLFRGLMQSALQALLPGVWPAILLTAAMFALVHYSTHALSIFALACCLGYAYERNGSLFRSIIIHILFNGISVIPVVLTS